MDINNLEELSGKLEGEIHWDSLHTSMYATDASVYRMQPLGVAYPRNISDLQQLIQFASENEVGLIPRTAGTSLAGQCVGPGLVVDVSRHFTKILELDVDKRQVRVEPGVVRDELNAFLKPHGLFFGPNTSTSNRCMIGGMAGNNSSGTTSIRYGVTRDKVLQMQVLLSDGSVIQAGPLTKDEFQQKTKGADTESIIYNKLYKELSDSDLQKSIKAEFPLPEIHRRNTGYAIDALLNTEVFGDNNTPFNLAKLLCGSEGTLAFTTELTLQLDPLPPPESAMIITHYRTLEDCLSDVVPAMEHPLYLCEMMDKTILDCTKNNRAQLRNRFFVEGDPAALLMLELRAGTEKDLASAIQNLQHTLKRSGKAYAAPVLYGSQIGQAIELRKAGLGLLGNMVGDRKAVACIEDTAVALKDLKDFIGEFTQIMAEFGQEAVYYAHAGAGELHLRPILNLKKKADVKLFREITTRVAHLTKKYRGSFSGEHGDGIVRAEFIPLMIGEDNYQLLRRVKGYFDPKGIFNPGKIVDAFPMDASLRYVPDRSEPEIETLLDFSDSQGILRAAEKCNGSGDCRKSQHMGGAMCPSYQATRNEKDTTRARANVLREMLTDPEKGFNRPELKEVFDLCLSCKACASECPSNVDIAGLKAELNYQYQEANGYPLRNRLFAHNTAINAINSRLSFVLGPLLNGKLSGSLIKGVLGVSKKRSIPVARHFNFGKYLAGMKEQSDIERPRVVLFIDEFTRYLDIQQGKDAIYLLEKLGYDVQLLLADSGRSFISKGFLKQARELAHKNAPALHALALEGVPLLGLEPSAILTFRDEYGRFGLSAEISGKIASNSFLIEEFLAAEIAAGRITSAHFTTAKKEVKIHNHCYQKALSNQKVTFDVLNIPQNYKVSIIASGCCGMAGSFGYEAEHFEVSMQVGNLKLFPAVQKAGPEVIIAANGTSCRHQIADGTGRKAMHPVSILKEALLN